MEERLISVENIVNAIQKEVEKCDNELDHIAELGVKGETDVAKALIITAHKEAFKKAILIAKTLF